MEPSSMGPYFAIDGTSYLCHGDGQADGLSLHNVSHRVAAADIQDVGGVPGVQAAALKGGGWLHVSVYCVCTRAIVPKS
jgi:hypothetical protein